MLRITSDRKVVEKRYTERFFQRIGESCGCGFGFACDNDGAPFLNHEGQRENFEFAVSHPDMFIDCGVQERISRYTEPARGICACGQEIHLVDEMLGACECPRCGQWYNLFGQDLLPPDKWSDEPDYF